MAFPFVSEANFEVGDNSEFDAEVDTDAKLDFPHFSDLARTPGIGMPYNGAYAMRVDLSGGTADAYVQETGAWDMTTGTDELYGRFMFWVDPNITMATTNEFSIFEFWSGTSTAEAGFYVNYTTANGLRLGIGKGSGAQFQTLPTGKWNAVEFYFNPAGSTNGTFDAWLNGTAFTQVASLSNANITSGVVGAFASGTGGYDAGTTRGILLFDGLLTDDARIYSPNERFPEEIYMTKSGHAFVGAGEIKNVTLLSGAGTDNVLKVFDTDVGNTNDYSSAVLELKNTANNETVDPAGVPARVRRGAYISLSGTNPRALVSICRAHAYHSEAAVRTYGLKRKATPGNV